MFFKKEGNQETERGKKEDEKRIEVCHVQFPLRK